MVFNNMKILRQKLMLNKNNSNIYILRKKTNILSISLKELLNRNFFLGKESFYLNKKVAKFFSGKRNNFLVINVEISLYILKKSMQCILDIFSEKVSSQILFYFKYNTEFLLMQKNLLKKTEIDDSLFFNNVKKYGGLKILKNSSSFSRQIYYLGKWKSGSISNFFKLTNYIFREVEKNFTLYKTFYPRKKVLSVFEKFLMLDHKFLYKNLRVVLKKIFQMKKNVKDKSSFFNKDDFRYTKKEKRIPDFLKKKLPISRLFFFKDNFFLIENLPEIIVTLSKNDILTREANIMKILNIGIVTPDKNINQFDFGIPGNSSRSLLLIYLKIFRSVIFLGRFKKVQNFILKKFDKKKKIDVSFIKIKKILINYQ